MYETRIKKIRAQLSAFRANALLLNDVTDLYYLTGMTVSKGQMLITKDRALLIVDGRYFEESQKRASCQVILTAPKILEKLLRKYSSIRRLGFDSLHLSHNGFLSLRREISNIKQRKISLVSLKAPLAPLRAIKDRREIALLHQAAQLGCEGYDYVCSLLHEGITESEIARALTIFWLERGCEGAAFTPIIAFGPNSSKPHYEPGNAELRRGQHVLIDIGAQKQHYCSDMTRIVFFGRPKKQIAEIYPIVRKAQEAALSLCRPGITLGQLDNTARQIIANYGYEQYFTHGLGHSLGLEIHEYPSVRNVPPHKYIILEEGMAITIEPGIYLPGIGGVRIEDTVVITKNGHTNLSARPKDIVCVH